VLLCLYCTIFNPAYCIVFVFVLVLTASEMTYIVSGGALNSTHSLYLYCTVLYCTVPYHTDAVQYTSEVYCVLYLCLYCMVLYCIVCCTLPTQDGLLSSGYGDLISRIHKQIPQVTPDGKRLQMVVCSATLHSVDVRKMAVSVACSLYRILLLPEFCAFSVS